MPYRKCRRAIGAKHLRAARLIVLENYSGYRALVESGFSKWTARNFGRLLRECWALRAAIEQVQRESQVYLDPAKVRRRRYQRKPVAEAVQKYLRGTAIETSNAGPRFIYKQEQAARAIIEGKRPSPVSCSVCGGALEGRDGWCARCERIEHSAPQ